VGHNWLGELWSDWLADDENELSQELGACMMTLSFFSSRSMAQALYCEGSDNERVLEQESFDAFAQTMRELLPSALASYSNVGRTIAEVTASER
jgi:hypothetical protein